VSRSHESPFAIVEVCDLLYAHDVVRVGISSRSAWQGNHKGTGPHNDDDVEGHRGKKEYENLPEVTISASECMRVSIGLVARARE
jgi:hypothetical protein